MFCNTDWPRPPTGPRRDLVWTEIGDANGENALPATARAPTAGSTARRTMRHDGAPAVVDDYNYPWQQVLGRERPQVLLPQRRGNSATDRYSGARPAARLAEDLRDRRSTCAGTITVTPPVAQTCVFTGNATTTGAPYTYRPPVACVDPLATS